VISDRDHGVVVALLGTREEAHHRVASLVNLTSMLFYKVTSTAYNNSCVYVSRDQRARQSHTTSFLARASLALSLRTRLGLASLSGVGGLSERAPGPAPGLAADRTARLGVPKLSVGTPSEGMPSTEGRRSSISLCAAGVITGDRRTPVGLASRDWARSIWLFLGPSHMTVGGAVPAAEELLRSGTSLDCAAAGEAFTRAAGNGVAAKRAVLPQLKAGTPIDGTPSTSSARFTSGVVAAGRLGLVSRDSARRI
jgi:hypothetical protein